MDKELTALIGRLQDHTKSCEDKCLDLKALKFEAKEGEMKLFLAGADGTPMKSYYFKADPKNPRDPKIIHAVKQFCKILSVPHNFFAKNTDFMKNQIVGTWLSSLKADKSAVFAKLRKSPEKDDMIIRALLPVEFTNMSNAELISIVGEAVKDDFRVEFVIGDERDDLTLHVRLISTESFEVCGEKCSTGFSVIVSELGAAPISVETFLFRDASKAAMIASYSGESFFETSYEGIQPTAVKELFPRLVSLLKDQLCELQVKIQSAKGLTENKDDISELMKNLRLRKGLNEKFHVLLFQEIEKNEVKNRWDFVNRTSILAKDFDVATRVKIEKAAGELIGLTFEKN
jgi:hypothetical protein